MCPRPSIGVANGHRQNGKVRQEQPLWSRAAIGDGGKHQYRDRAKDPWSQAARGIAPVSIRPLGCTALPYPGTDALANSFRVVWAFAQFDGAEGLGGRRVQTSLHLILLLRIGLVSEPARDDSVEEMCYACVLGARRTFERALQLRIYTPAVHISLAHALQRSTSVFRMSTVNRAGS